MHAPLDVEPTAEEMNGMILRLLWGVNAQAFRCFGEQTLAGPFPGMMIPSHPPWDDGNSGTKLLGGYEHELHEAIEEVGWREPKVVVNVGCSEGYYAIGFALKFKIPVYAFDIDTASLDVCREYADKNRANITLVHGTKDARELRLLDAPSGHRFYLFDCEGDELELVDPELCPELQRSDLIIECHDFLRPHCSRRLADRLSSTHRVEMIRQKFPDLARYRFLRPTIMSVLTVTELRPIPCCWLVCWANRRGD